MMYYKNFVRTNKCFIWCCKIIRNTFITAPSPCLFYIALYIPLLKRHGFFISIQESTTWIIMKNNGVRSFRLSLEKSLPRDYEGGGGALDFFFFFLLTEN